MPFVAGLLPGLLRPAHALTLALPQDLAAGSNVWLVDHFITFTQVNEFCGQLRRDEALLRRVAALVEADGDDGGGGEVPADTATAAGVAEAGGGGAAAASDDDAMQCDGGGEQPEAATAAPAAAAAVSALDRLYGDVKRRLHAYVHQFDVKVSAAAPAVRYKYIMDELGSRLRAADEPNVTVAAFVFQRPGGANVEPYCLMWPIQVCVVV